MSSSSQRLRKDREAIIALCEELMEQVTFWHSQDVYTQMEKTAKINFLQLGVNAGHLVNHLEAQNAAESGTGTES
jgi:hypothetical protein